MGLYRSNASYVNLPAIQAELSPAIELWFSAQIQVINPGMGGLQRNEWTNTPSPGASDQRSLIWAGAARASVQATPKTKDIDPGFNDTFLSPVRFQIPTDYANQSGIRKGFIVYVLDGGNNEQLQDYQYVIHRILGASTNAVVTLECGVDNGAFGSFGPI